MRAPVLLAFCLLLSLPAHASIVIHGGTPGIIAAEVGVVLDSNGHTWNLHPSGWTRWPEYDPPVPVEEILFWHYHYLVTMNLEAWVVDGGWHSIGKWPDLPATVEEGAPFASAAAEVSPNPSAGSCRVAFRVPSEGSVKVEILDVSGRVVRRLLDAQQPVGDYSLEWDGRDDGGRDLPAGVYFARMATAEGTTSSRIVLTR